MLASFSGNIVSGAFNKSRMTLDQFIMENSVDGSHNNKIEAGAFHENPIRIIQLGNNFNVIKSGAFKALPNVEEIRFSPKTLRSVESEAFDNLPKVTNLDLSNQYLLELPLNVFKNLPNLTEIDLSSNHITHLKNSIFYNVPKLLILNLRDNQICSIGNFLEHLNNPNLILNLSNNKLKYLVEDSFKPYLENKKNKGYIDITENEFKCSCDLKWLLTTNYQWRDILVNGTCQNGKTLDQVNLSLLENMCPSESCSGYNSQTGWPSLTDVITSPNYPNPYPANYPYSKTITLKYVEPSFKLRFTNFSTERYDRLSIWDDNQYYWIENYAGNELPTPSERIFKSTKVHISFRFDGSLEDSGWRIEKTSESDLLCL